MVLVEFVDRSADGLAFGLMVFRHFPLTRPWLPYHVQFSWQPGPGSPVVAKENKAATLMVAASLPNGSPSCNLVGSMWMSTDCVSKTKENLPPSLRLHSTSRQSSPSSKCSHSLLRECLPSVVLLSFPSFTNQLVIAVDLSARLFQTLGSTSIAI
jgi:hypothetical protein